jgi:hypothetical protein
MRNAFDILKKEYMEVTIPNELEYIVNKAIKDSLAKYKSNKRLLRKLTAVVAMITIIFALLAFGVNISPAFADTLEKVPLIGDLVKVITIKAYKIDENNYRADIKVPQINGLIDKGLQSSLNEKYMEEDKKLYKQFMVEMESLKNNKSEAKIGLFASYEIKTDNDLILSIGRYSLKIAADSDTKIKYDTVDKKRQLLITLPSLFTNDSYIGAISNNIIAQMREQMKKDEGVQYWLEKAPYIEPFKQIKPDQNFYINPDGKLVISFDRAEVAPGCMGNPEFVIPTEVISSLLVSNEYLK